MLRSIERGGRFDGRGGNLPLGVLTEWNAYAGYSKRSTRIFQIGSPRTLHGAVRYRAAQQRLLANSLRP